MSGARPRRRSPPQPDVPGLAARRAAAAMLGAVLDRGRMLEEPDSPLPPAERAQARALADLALRRLPQIDQALGALVPRLPRPPVIHVLRVMAAELMFGGQAAHAAVDLAVRQVKSGAGAPLAGLVNAVGRKLGQAGEVAPEPSLPDWLRARLGADWGPARTLAIAAAHMGPPPLDLSFRSAAEADRLAPDLGGERLGPTGLRLAQRGQVTALPGYADGAWWVQDAAAALPVRLLGPVSGRRVLDLCAAPGGKTLQLAALGADVTALDVSAERLERLRSNLARTGLTARILAAEALDWSPDAPFDAILLDAPCSATGTIRRHPDLPYRFDSATLPGLTALQARLLERAWDWLKPGGTLVFATCSVLRAEGEDQAAAFRERTGIAPLADPPVPPELTDAAGDLRCLPCDWAGRGGLDGFFAARFRRPASHP